MKFAVLFQNPDLVRTVADALAERGVEFVQFQELQALTSGLAEHPFGAVLLQESSHRLEAWLSALQSRVDAQTAVVVHGPRGASNISRALCLGADDYVVDGEELDILVQRAIARMSAKIHRHRQRSVRLRGFEVSDALGHLIAGQRQVPLTPREIKLVQIFFEHPRRVLSVDELCLLVCGKIDDQAERAIKQHIYQLRKKLKALSHGQSESMRIENSYGNGYRLAY